jgi:hypothetical protein
MSDQIDQQSTVTSEYIVRLPQPDGYSGWTRVKGHRVPCANEVLQYKGEFYQAETIVHEVVQSPKGGFASDVTVILDPRPLANPFQHAA